MKIKTPVGVPVYHQDGQTASSIGEKLKQVEPSFSVGESINLCNHVRKPSGNMIKTDHMNIL